MVTVAIYIRVSTDKQTPENQLEPCKNFCKEKGFDIFGKFVDVDKSAYHNVYRKEYEKVKTLIQSNKIDGVVVWALDRWTRRGAKEVQNTLTFFSTYDCKLYSVQEYWVEQLMNLPRGLGEIFGPLMYQILGWIAQQESQHKSERVKASLKFQKAKDKGLVGRPSLSENIRKQVIDLLRQGKSYSYIHNNVTYKGKYGKIKHISRSMVGNIAKQIK